MAFKKRSAFEEFSLSEAKNSYEKFERTKSKALKDYDMRPWWIKNEDISNNPDHAERAGADEEEEESLPRLKKALKRTAYDDVMDVVLGSQKVIHERATAAHEDRMNILRQFCGYSVWAAAEKDNAPGAAMSVVAQIEGAFNDEGAPIEKTQTLFVPKMMTTDGQQQQGGEQTKTKTTTKTLFHHDNPPLHPAILTPPYHGAIPLDHKHLMKGQLSFKMENAIGRMHQAVVEFQQANDAAREEMLEKMKLKNSNNNDNNNAVVGGSNHKQQQVVIGMNATPQQISQNKMEQKLLEQKQSASLHQQYTLGTSALLEKRMAREQRLEEGLFTPFFQQDSVSGLRGSPTSDPKATASPPRYQGNRRYPEPFAFVIH
jgi:hypothetical protein